MVPGAPTQTSKISRLVRRLFVLIASALWVLLVYFRLGFLPSQSRFSSRPSDPDLGVRANLETDGILVHWNPEIEVLRSAKNGVLNIDDGAQKHATELDPAELAIGSLLYKPISDDVDFRLTVFAGDGSVLSDGVRVLETLGQITTWNAAAATSHRQRPIPPQTSHLSLVVHTTKNATGSATRHSAQSSGSADRAVIANRETINSYVPPSPAKTVMVNARSFQSSALAGIDRIEVEVDIDKIGRVTGARFLTADGNVSQQLLDAVLAAAKLWTFEPAKIGGRSVPAKHLIVFHFGKS